MSVSIHDGRQFQLIPDALPDVAVPLAAPNNPTPDVAPGGADDDELAPSGIGVPENNPPLAAETVDASGKPVPNVKKF